MTTLQPKGIDGRKYNPGWPTSPRITYEQLVEGCGGEGGSDRALKCRGCGGEDGSGRALKIDAELAVAMAAKIKTAEVEMRCGGRDCGGV